MTTGRINQVTTMGRGRGGAALRRHLARPPTPPRRALRLPGFGFGFQVTRGARTRWSSRRFPSEAHDPPVGAGRGRRRRDPFASSGVPRTMVRQGGGTASAAQSSRRARLNPDMHRQGGGCPWPVSNGRSCRILTRACPRVDGWSEAWRSANDPQAPPLPGGRWGRTV